MSACDIFVMLLGRKACLVIQLTNFQKKKNIYNVNDIKILIIMFMKRLYRWIVSIIKDSFILCYSIFFFLNFRIFLPKKTFEY